MRMHPFPAALLAAATLAGCADSEPARPAAAVQTPATALQDVAPLLGPWTVVEVFASGPSRTTVPALTGQVVRLEPRDATDLLGRTCDSPGLTTVKTTRRDFFHYRTDKASGDGDQPVTVLRLSCGGQPFGDYAAWGRDGLLAWNQGYYLRLERGKRAVAEAVAAPASAAPAPAADHAVEAGPPAALYLASYRSEASARIGWRDLAAQSPALAKLTPRMTPVALKGKGKFIRLFAEAPAADFAGICRALKAQSPDCGASYRK